MSLKEEFQVFASRGSVMDIALAVVIGTAFSKAGTQFVEQVAMPFLSRHLPFGDWGQWALGGYRVGGLVSALLELGLMSLATFAAVLPLLNRLMRRRRAVQPEQGYKTCPACREQVALQATRCKWCTSSLD
jgi:large conductance mechanosensitive channel